MLRTFLAKFSVAAPAFLILLIKLEKPVAALFNVLPKLLVEFSLSVSLALYSSSSFSA